MAWLSVVVGVFVAFFWPATLYGRYLIGGDSWSWSLPLRALAWEQIRHGQLPGWTPALMSGYPLLSMGQLSIAYPLTWGYLFDPAWGEQIYILAPFVLSPMFTYAYARSVGRSRGAALLAGFSFGYGGAMASSITHNGMLSNGFMWLPLVLTFLERSRTKPYVPCLLGASAAYGLAVLTGIGQGFLFNGLVVVAYCVFTGVVLEGGSPWRSWKRWRVASIGFLAIPVGAGIGAFQIWETERAHRESIRSTLPFELFIQGSATFEQIVESLARPLFAGIGDMTAYVAPFTLVLAATAFVPRCFRQLADRRALFWAAIAAISWVLMLGVNTPLFRLLHHVPVINQFRVPARHAIEWTFAAAILGAYGWDALQRIVTDTGRRGVGPLRAGLATACLALTVALAFRWLKADAEPTQYLVAKVFLAAASLVTLGIGFTLAQPVWQGALFALLSPLACVTEAYLGQNDSWLQHAKTRERMDLVSPSTLSLLRSAPTEYRVYSYLIAFVDHDAITPRVDPPNRSGWLGLHDVGGYEPLILSRYSKALGDADLFAMAVDKKTHAAFGDPFNPRSRVLDVLNAAFVVRQVAPGEAVIPAEWTRMPRLDRVVLDIGVPETRECLLDGFSGNEVLGNRSGVWTDGASSKLGLRLLPNPVDYQLTIETGSFTPATPLDVTVVANGTVVGALSITPGWIERSIRIPANALIEGMNELELRYSRTASPAASNPKATDHRELALFIDSLAVTPL